MAAWAVSVGLLMTMTFSAENRQAASAFDCCDASRCMLQQLQQMPDFDYMVWQDVVITSFHITV